MRGEREIVDVSMRISVEAGKDCNSGGERGKLIKDGKGNRMFGDFSFSQC